MPKDEGDRQEGQAGNKARVNKVNKLLISKTLL